MAIDQREALIAAVRAQVEKEKAAKAAKLKKEQEAMRSAVKTGDHITSIGGIIGVVVNVKESSVVMETGADQVRIELAKWAISTNETAAAAAEAEAKKAKEAKAKAKAAKKAEK